MFGFLSLGTDEYSGNMGLKDQLLALRWVNENIHKFGGDNKRITLFGHSSGSVAAYLNVLSKWQNKLFQRVIAMSGSILNTWSMHRENDHLSLVRRFGKLIF